MPFWEAPRLEPIWSEMTALDWARTAGLKFRGFCTDMLTTQGGKSTGAPFRLAFQSQWDHYKEVETGGRWVGHHGCE